MTILPFRPAGSAMQFRERDLLLAFLENSDVEEVRLGEEWHAPLGAKLTVFVPLKLIRALEVYAADLADFEETDYSGCGEYVGLGEADDDREVDLGATDEIDQRVAWSSLDSVPHDAEEDVVAIHHPLKTVSFRIHY